MDYGNGINESISYPFNLYDKNFRKDLDKFKSAIRHKRKPTDIIIIADGFSYSATSVFLKFLQYYGGGITVGYFGHPGKKIFHLIVVYPLRQSFKMNLYI